MTREHDVKIEEKESRRRIALVKALEYGLVGSLETQGITLEGFAIRYEPFACLMTLRATEDGKRVVAFVGSDSIMNCLLKSEGDAANHRLRWRPDKYQTD